MHYYKRNLGDYAKKAGRLTMLQHGAYTLLIDACYDREQFPTLEQAIEWCWASTPDEICAVKFILSRFFVLEDGFYVQDRIRQEVTEYHDKAAKNKRIAQEREDKRREACTKRAQYVNEAPPNHKPRTINQEPRTNTKTKAASDDAVLFPEVDPQVVSDFKALRKAVKAAITATAMRGIADQASKAGMSLEAALRICCVRGWRSFKAEWLLDRHGSSQQLPSGNLKFRPNGSDHSSSKQAMEKSMIRHGIVADMNQDTTL